MGAPNKNYFFNARAPLTLALWMTFFGAASGGGVVSNNNNNGRGKPLLDVTHLIQNSSSSQPTGELEKLLRYGKHYAHFESSSPISLSYLKEQAGILKSRDKDAKYYLSFRQIDATQFAETVSDQKNLSLSPVVALIWNLTGENCSSAQSSLKNLPSYFHQVKQRVARYSLKLGLHLDQENSKCKYILETIPTADFVALTQSFQTQRFPESYTLWGDYVTHIYNQNRAVVEKINPQVDNIIMFFMDLKLFSVTANSSGLNSQYILLLGEYCHRWSLETGHSIILRLPDYTPLTRAGQSVIHQDSTNRSEFIIPNMFRLGLPKVVRSSLWFSLSTISSSFTTLNVDDGMWEDIHYALRGTADSADGTGNSKLKNPLHVIVEVNKEIRNVDHFKNMLRHILSFAEPNRRHNVILKAVDFAMNVHGRQLIELNSKEKPGAAEALGNTTTGCLIYIDIETWSLTTILQKTETFCDFVHRHAIHFSFIVNFKIWGEDDALSGEPSRSYHAYVTSVQAKLNVLLEVRESLIHQKPAGVVAILKVHTPSVLPEHFYCKEELLRVNAVYEAIANWGRIHQFPVLLKNAFESDSVIGWWSHLSLSAVGVGRVSDKVPPQYVMRNHPRGIIIANNGKVDPCVQWSSKEVGISPIKFGAGMGATINMELRNTNMPLNITELQMMLILSLHRFQRVEILLGNGEAQRRNLKTLKEALSPSFFASLKEHHQFNVNGNLYVQVSGNKASEIVSDLKELSTRIKATAPTSLTLAGVHLTADYPNTQEISQFLQQLRKTKNADFRLGLQMSMENCTGLLNQLASEGSAHSNYPAIDYLLCETSSPVTAEIPANDKQPFADLMDSTLFLKKAFFGFRPKQETIFRISSVPCCGSLEIHNYLRFLNDMNQFASGNEMGYFAISAFSPETANYMPSKTESTRSTSWWTISNYTDLSNGAVFRENEADIHNRTTWTPKGLSLFQLKQESANNSNDGHSKLKLAAAGGGIIGGLGLILLLVVAVTRRFRSKKSNFLSESEVQEFFHGRSKLDSRHRDSTLHRNASFDTRYSLDKTDFQFTKSGLVGKGFSCKTSKGLCRGILVAVKSSRAKVTKENFAGVLMQVKAMSYVGDHENIVKFLGAYVNEIEKGVIYVAIQLCEHGSLLTYLKKMKEEYHHSSNLEMVDVTMLIKFADGIASGMEFLWDRDIIHGDLCAKNVLLDRELTAKLSNFGSARSPLVYQNTTGIITGKEPFRWQWMAYESLAKMKLTSMSDAWSYGITLCEIFSLGETPYPGKAWSVNFPEEIRNGSRPDKPYFASDRMLHKMEACWTLNPIRRPTFSCIRNFLNQTLYPDSSSSAPVSTREHCDLHDSILSF